MNSTTLDQPRESADGTASQFDWAAVEDALFQIETRVQSVNNLVTWSGLDPYRIEDARILAEAVMIDIDAFRAIWAGGNTGVKAEEAIDTLLAEVRQTLDRWAKARLPVQRQDYATRLLPSLLSLSRAVEEALVSRLRKEKGTGFGRQRRLDALKALGAICFVILLGWLFVREGMPRIQYPLFATRIADLRAIDSALEAYRVQNGAYPVSQDNGAGYNGIGWAGEQDNWIPGLAPSFIAALPRDPRNIESPHNQYVYRSDGQNYKIVALNPEDCYYVTKRYPALADPRRVYGAVCLGYGHWTAGAVEW